MYRVTKTYGHERGLSACFRQWRADHSHCSLLHGYSLSVELVFESSVLDHRNWVIDFGGVDWIKNYLERTFDHKTLVAADDPEFSTFESLDRAGIIDMIPVKRTGCESFSQMVFEHIRITLAKIGFDNAVRIVSVKIAEHGSNSATYIG